MAETGSGSLFAAESQDRKPAPAPEPLLTREDLCRLLGLTAETVKIMCMRGVFPEIRLSPKTYRYRLSDVERVLQSLTVPARAEAHTGVPQ